MELFYILSVIGMMSQIDFVNGGHSDTSVGGDQTYGQSSLGSRTMTRFGSRLVSPTRTTNRGVQRRGRPHFFRRQFYQRPRANAMPYHTHIRNYQTLPSRNIIQPVLSQPLARPLLRRPPVNFHQRPPVLRRFDLREIGRTLNGAHQPDTISVNRAEHGLKQKEKNSLLALLEERRPVIRDENDLLLIREHLIEINSVGSNHGLTKDQILEKQVECIENITDIDIQREVLKIFVKDMVEKSGFLSQNTSSVQDIDALTALVDKVSAVTDKFTNLSPHLAIDPLQILNNIQAIDSALGELPTTTDHPSTISENRLRQNIISALSTYDRNAHVSRVQSDPVNRRLQTFQSRRRQDSHPRAGMSIFGDVDIETTTLQSETTGAKRGIEPEISEYSMATFDSSVREPLGGNSAYWTHLQAGLVDMLCNLCQQLQREACISRYCSNDRIRTETETPAPSMFIAAS